MIILQLPIPPRELSPNGRVYHKRKSAAVKEYREQVETMARLFAPPQPYERATVEIVFCTLNARMLGLWCPRDADNAAGGFKAGLDGLRDGGILREDGWRQVGRVTASIDPTRGPYVEVTVTEVVG